MPLEVQRISIGRIFDRAWSVIRRNPVLTIALSFVLGAIPVVGFDYLIEDIDRSALVLTLAGYALPGVVALFFLQVFVGLVIGVLMQGAMIAPILAAEQGTDTNFAAAAASGLRGLVALMLLGVLTGIAVEIGLTLLVVPGIVVYLLWSVAPSALVAEREGLFLALDRSQDLTQGVRWKVFALLLFLEVLNAVLGIGTLLTARFAGIPLRLQDSPGYLVVLILLNTISCLMWATVQGALYVELVERKEGGSVDKLEQVFA
jgi:hypothetical protein